MTEILDKPAEGTVVANPASPAGNGQSPENWEERFKGQQREYNKLQATLTAKETALQTMKQRLDAATSEQNTVLSEAVLKETDLTAKMNALNTELETQKNRAAELDKKLAETQSRQSQRAALIAADGTDLLEVFENGDLNIAGLEGDALKTKLTSYRAAIQKLAEKTFSGAVPPNPPVNQTQTPSGLNFEQLGDWLMDPKNQSKDEYDSFMEQYNALIPKP